MERITNTDEASTVLLLQQIMSKLVAMENKALEIEKHQGAIKERHENLEKQMDVFFSAFPNNDLDGHHKYHESLIRWSNLRNELVSEALKKAAQAGLVFGIFWVAYAIYEAIKMEFLK